MGAASGLAAEIEKTFGVAVELLEGHNGIYEVSVNEDVIYTNQGKCSRFPMVGKIKGSIAKYVDPLPGEKLEMTEVLPTL